MQFIARNWRTWVARYGWAELFGTMGSYVGYYLAHALIGISAMAAYGAATGENIGFYGYFMWRTRRDQRLQGTGQTFARTLRDLVYEFGTAELLDFLIFRPGATFLAVSLFGSAAGVLIGKIVADVIFYSLAAAFYERRKARQQP
jgi:hypothetical protein